MNLHSNLQYPLLKYLSEEFTGKFYSNELTFLNRLLILYHNRYTFSIDDNTAGFLDEFETSLEEPVVYYWYIKSPKRQRIYLLRKRFSYLIKHNRDILERLLSREDYSSYEAKQEAIVEIYQWLNNQSDRQGSAINLAGWKEDIEASLSYLLEKPAQPGRKRPSRKPGFDHFYQILTGKNKEAKKAKFEKLVKILLAEQWILETENPGIYRYRKNKRGSLRLLGALYYCLSQQGHIEEDPDATQIAGLFTSWLLHRFTQGSLEKIFQKDQLDLFNCSHTDKYYDYVQDCRLLIGKL